MLKKIIAIVCSSIFIVSFSYCGNTADAIINNEENYTAENNYNVDNKNKNNNPAEIQNSENKTNNTQEEYESEEENVGETSLEILNSIYALPEKIETIKETGYYSDSIIYNFYSLPDDKETIEIFRDWYCSLELKEEPVYDFMKNFDYVKEVITGESDFCINGENNFAFTVITVDNNYYIGNRNIDTYYPINKSLTNYINETIEESFKEAYLEVLNSIYTLPKTIESVKISGYFSGSEVNEFYTSSDGEESIKNFNDWYYSLEMGNNPAYNFIGSFDYENNTIDSEIDFYINGENTPAFTFITVGLYTYIGNRDSDTYYRMHTLPHISD